MKAWETHCARDLLASTSFAETPGRAREATLHGLLPFGIEATAIENVPAEDKGHAPNVSSAGVLDFGPEAHQNPWLGCQDPAWPLLSPTSKFHACVGTGASLHVI